MKLKHLVGPVFDCGEALVGQMKVCRYIIENSGGEGRFVILPKSAWPTINFKVCNTNTFCNLFVFFFLIISKTQLYLLHF